MVTDRPTQQERVARVVAGVCRLRCDAGKRSEARAPGGVERGDGPVLLLEPGAVLAHRVWRPGHPKVRLVGLQNAMTSSEERTSAEAEGYRIERALMDCVALPF